MQGKLKALYKRHGDFLRYLIIGGLTTLVDNGIFALAHGGIGLHYQTANAAAWVVAVSFAFLGNKWVVFRTPTKDGRSLLLEAARFTAMRLLTLLFSVAFLYAAIDLLGIDEFLSKAVSSVAVIALNYVLSKLVVFKSPRS